MNQPIKERFEEFLREENVDNLRESLIAIMDHRQFRLTRVATLLGITAPTLRKFLEEKGQVSFQTLLKVNDFVEEMKHNIKRSFK